MKGSNCNSKTKGIQTIIINQKNKNCKWTEHNWKFSVKRWELFTIASHVVYYSNNLHKWCIEQVRKAQIYVLEKKTKLLMDISFDFKRRRDIGHISIFSLLHSSFKALSFQVHVEASIFLIEEIGKTKGKTRHR